MTDAHVISGQVLVSCRRVVSCRKVVSCYNCPPAEGRTLRRHHDTLHHISFPPSCPWPYCFSWRIPQGTPAGPLKVPTPGPFRTPRKLLQDPKDSPPRTRGLSRTLLQTLRDTSTGLLRIFYKDTAPGPSRTPPPSPIVPPLTLYLPRYLLGGCTHLSCRLASYLLHPCTHFPFFVYTHTYCLSAQVPDTLQDLFTACMHMLVALFTSLLTTCLAQVIDVFFKIYSLLAWTSSRLWLHECLQYFSTCLASGSYHFSDLNCELCLSLSTILCCLRNFHFVIMLCFHVLFAVYTFLCALSTFLFSELCLLFLLHVFLFTQSVAFFYFKRIFFLSHVTPHKSLLLTGDSIFNYLLNTPALQFCFPFARIILSEVLDLIFRSCCSNSVYVYRGKHSESASLWCLKFVMLAFKLISSCNENFIREKKTCF